MARGKRIDVSSYKIEKGVPIPAAKVKKPLTIGKFLKKLKPGDSVLLKGITSYHTAHNAGWLYIGKGKTTVRKTPQGYRLWRVK